MWLLLILGVLLLGVAILYRIRTEPVGIRTEPVGALLRSHGFQEVSTHFVGHEIVHTYVRKAGGGAGRRVTEVLISNDGAQADNVRLRAGHEAHLPDIARGELVELLSAHPDLLDGDFSVVRAHGGHWRVDGTVASDGPHHG